MMGMPLAIERRRAGPALAVGMAAILGASGARPAAAQPPPNFIRELRYTCYPDKTQDLIAYFARLADADIKINSGRMRWMDGAPYGHFVIAGIPAYHLAEYDSRVGSGTVFSKAFGEEEYRKYAQGYSNAQMRTHSVIRRYRDDLSRNRAKHLRATTRVSRYTYVTVKPGKGTLFEQATQKAVAALGQVAPGAVLSAAQTMAGGGPQYLLVEPFASYEDLGKAVDLAAAVEKAFGKAEAAAWRARLAEAVENTEVVLMQKVAKDSFVP